MSPAVASKRPAPGFTLIEVLVALAVFALASTLAYRGLNSVSDTKATLDREIRFWRELGLVFERIETDLLQVVPQAWPTAALTASPPLRAEPLGEHGFLLEFTRQDGLRPPLRVTYLCQSGRFEMRLASLGQPLVSASAASLQEPALPGLLLFAPVERCEAAYLDKSNTWRTSWPLRGAPPKPQAVRLILELPGHGRFERIFALP